MGSSRQSRSTGSYWENAVAKLFKALGFPYAERRRLSGSKDRGDLAGVPLVTVEVKADKSYSIPEWLRELEIEQANTGDPYGVLVVKPKGITDPARFWAIRYLEDDIALLREVSQRGTLTDELMSRFTHMFDEMHEHLHTQAGATR